MYVEEEGRTRGRREKEILGWSSTEEVVRSAARLPGYDIAFEDVTFSYDSADGAALCA